MMIHSTKGSTTISYLTTNTTTVSVKIGQHETRTNSTASKDSDTPQDDSSTALDKKYSVGDMCMVTQTSKWLQFRTSRIQKTSDNTVSVVYLLTNESGINSIGQ